MKSYLDSVLGIQFQSLSLRSIFTPAHIMWLTLIPHYDRKPLLQLVSCTMDSISSCSYKSKESKQPKALHWQSSKQFSRCSIRVVGCFCFNFISELAGWQCLSFNWFNIYCNSCFHWWNCKKAERHHLELNSESSSDSSAGFITFPTL